MFRATHIHTGLDVDAEDLWSMEPIDPDGFVCPDCGSKVYPTSYRPENLRRAHFAAKPKCPPWCPSNGETDLLKQARTHSLTAEDGSFPGYMPSGFRLPADPADAPASAGAGTAAEGGPGRRAPAAAPEPGARQRPRITTSFRDICRAYLNFPNDRHRALQFLDLYGSTYDEVVWRLRARQDRLIRYPIPHLFYGPIGWRAPEETDEYALIETDVKVWQDGKPGQAYRVKVRWGDWTPRQRNALLKEVRTASEEAKELKKSGSKDRSLLFFVGEQEKGDDATFVVRERKLICCLTGPDVRPTAPAKRG
ncbi:hypothetical protein RKE25_07685 [Dyella sp. BiH032]|uniref:hypothetical protein n=1 Tax=Dyella sp. BiH032 TaxID=3075430 RepID=UPI002892C275|nr:hypothetical protein [Dyella sp. BiH032]WNL47504.1 hypothetical protein RKE25_07685 [Dyella sp. BiH032]